MIVGMDFGTTNSGMAVFDGQELRRLPLDFGSDNPRVIRSALYITNEQEIFIGRTAIDRYFEHNVGRPVKLEKIWVGEVEVIADEVYFVQDAYVWADVMSPGRLFLSFKTNLRDHQYTGTVIGHFFYPIESLLALYLYVTRLRAQQLLGQELKEVVLGRPVHFANDPEHDNLAQERLLRGAFQAGYERVYLQREPIAAAYHYASLADSPQNILVFDFGGGTLDITVMRLGEGVRQVLATGGVPIAGDVFDQKLVRDKLPKHFGEGQQYGPRQMPVPRWIFDTFSSWQTILELQTPQNRRILQEIEQTAQRPREIRALHSLVSGNYSLQMFDTVEQTKRSLSDRFGGMIRLTGPEFDVVELVTRREFENIIRPEYLQIERHVQETLQASGMDAAEIDAVIRTGGSAEIPLFQQMLQQKFGRDKVHSVDTFGSVTAGLGIIAHGIASGEIEARAYTRDDLLRQDVTVNRPNVSLVDLALLKRRVQMRETADEETSGQQRALVLLTADNELEVVPLENGLQEVEQAIPPVYSAVLADLDEPLLLITSRYRFLLISPRQLQDMQILGQTLARLHHFRPHEEIFAVNRWSAVTAQERILITTSTGFVRIYPTDVLATSIEAPVPLTFEQPLPGWPIAVCAADRSQQLVLVTDGGRGIRCPLRDLSVSGTQVLNREDDEWVVYVGVLPLEAELVLLTDKGYGRRLPVAAVHEAEKTNSKGRILISRRPLQAAARLEPDLWALTGRRAVPVQATELPLEADSTRSRRLLKMAKGEEVRSLL